MKTITETYFGVEIVPLKIIETEYGKLYIGKIEINNKIVYYDYNGDDSMDLSSIDIKEFEDIILNNKI